MNFQDTMDYRNIASLNAEHNDVTNTNGLVFVVGKEQEVTTIKRRLHGATEDNHDWTFTACDNH